MTRASGQGAIEQHLQITLYHAERTPYDVLDGRIEHPHWAVSHVRAGDVWTAANGEAFHAPAGTVMVHPPHLPYSERGDRPGTHEWLVFEATLGPHLDLFRFHPAAPVVTLPDPASWSRTFDRLLAFWRSPDAPYREMRLSALAADLLTELIEAWHRAGAEPRPPAWVSAEDRFTAVIRHMERSLARKVTRVELAELVHLHPSSFDRAFREAFGVPPMAVLREMRLRQARRMLESSDATLSAIAESCGFEDAAYLGRVFHARFGQTPGQYRREAQAAPASYEGAFCSASARQDA